MCSENFYFHNRYSEYTNETTDFTSCDRKVDDFDTRDVIKIFIQWSVCFGDSFWRQGICLGRIRRILLICLTLYNNVFVIYRFRFFDGGIGGF